MYSNLPSDLQNIITFNYQYTADLFFVFVVLFFSLFHIFYYKKNVEKKTNLFSVAITRFLATAIAGVTIFFTPFALYLVKPSVVDNAFITTYVIFYTIYISLLLVIFFWDVFRYTPFVILKMAGVDFDDPEVNKVYKNIENELNKIPFFKKHGRK